MYGISLAEPVGYYVTCDDALCTRCAPAGFASGDYSEWPGFEGWESPAAIFPDTESDTPTHCHQCGDLIKHDLTIDGTDYVAEKIAEFITSPRPNSVVPAWWEHYGRTFSDSELKSIIDDAMEKAQDSAGDPIPGID